MKSKTAQKSESPSSYVTLPQAQYAHTEAATEWWWHIGTLVEKSSINSESNASPKLFGFEINTVSFDGIKFNQICLTDVSGEKHYQAFEMGAPVKGKKWAEDDPSKDWYVQLDGKTTKVYMQAPQSDPTNMHVSASFNADGTNISFDLQLNQQGNPLMVFGDGYHLVNKAATKPMDRYNFYYSLTNLKVIGTVTIGEVTYPVEGKTWMDHEYGAFPPSTKWLLQDIQLENGVSISNTCVTSVPFKEGAQVDGKASVLLESGDSVFIDTKMTPKSMKSINGYDYFMEFDVEINNTQYAIDASFTVKTLLDNQVFTGMNASIYEGAANLTGSYNGHTAVGTAWIEQNLAKPVSRNHKHGDMK